MSYLPDVPRSQSVVLSRREQKALARQWTATGHVLIAVDHAALLERARVRALGGIASDAIDEVAKLADEVVVHAQRNSLAGQMSAELAVGASRAMKERIDLANRRLG